MKEANLPERSIFPMTTLPSICMRAFRRRAYSFRLPRWLGGLCLACALLPLAGCKDGDEIRKYTVPRSDTPQIADDPDGKVRMLVAVFQPSGNTWFFKMVGATDAVDQAKESFEAFVQSVRFTGQEKEPVTWTVPAGWKKQPDQPNRHAVFRVSEKEPELELTIDRLGSTAGGLLANVKRWRGQIGLKPIGASDLPRYTRESKVNDVPMTLVTLTGNHMPTKGMGMLPPVANVPRQPAGAAPINYTKPGDWKELPAPSDGITLIAFQAGDSTKVTISRAGGDVAMNIDRWSGQVGLETPADRERGKTVKEMQVAGRSAVLVDLTGPESAGASRLRLLACIIPANGQSWFVKMRGPAQQVAAQKNNFEKFVGTINFGEGQGAKP
jgi:hypothetical protein